MMTRSKLPSTSSLRLVASPSWNRQFVKPSAWIRARNIAAYGLPGNGPRTGLLEGRSCVSGRSHARMGAQRHGLIVASLDGYGEAGRSQLVGWVRQIVDEPKHHIERGSVQDCHRSEIDMD